MGSALQNWLRRRVGSFVPFVTTEDARKIVLIYLVTTAFLWLIAFGASTVFHENDIPAPHYSPIKPLDVWGRWDSGHYLVIARWGYDDAPPESNAPWFPLYPYLVAFFTPNKASALPSDVWYPYFLTALAISHICFVLLLLVLFDLVAPWRGKRVALLAVLYISIFPSALYFRAIYTESLFTLLGLLSYRAFVREKYLACGVFGALAAMTRLPGIMLLVAFGSAVLWRMARRESLLRSVPVFIELIAGPIIMALATANFIRWRGNDALVLAAVGAVIFVGHLVRNRERFRFATVFVGLIPVGLVAVMLIQWHAVDDPLAFLHAVTTSPVHNRRITFPGFSLTDDFKYMRWVWDFRTGAFVMPQLIVDDLLVFLGLAGAFYFFRRYGFVAGCFTLGILLPPLMSGRTVGLIRYAIPAFPYFVFLADVAENRPWFHTVWVFVSSLLLSFYTMCFACWYWAA